MHKCLPVLNDLLNVWGVGYEEPPDDPGDAPDEESDKAVLDKYAADLKAHNEYLRKVHILEWYVDMYLTATIGFDHWSTTNRPYKFITDKYKGPDGKQYITCTRASEAFGLVQFENSRDKWIEVFKWKDQHGWKRKAPTYNQKKQETHKFKAKWSDYKTGQCSGWDPVAYQTFVQRKQQIVDIRKKEVDNDLLAFKFGQELIKAKYDIPAGQTTHQTGKRKRAASEEEEDESDAMVFEIMFEDEDAELEEA